MLYCEIVQLFITIDKINCVPMDCWRWNILNFNHQWCVAMRFRFVPKKHAKKRRRRKKINSINICLYKAIYSTGQMASNFFLKIPSNFSFKSFRVIVKQPRVCSRFHFLRFRGRRASHILAQNRGHLCSEGEGTCQIPLWCGKKCNRECQKIDFFVWTICLLCSQTAPKSWKLVNLIKHDNWIGKKVLGIICCRCKNAERNEIGETWNSKKFTHRPRIEEPHKYVPDLFFSAISSIIWLITREPCEYVCCTFYYIDTYRYLLLIERWTQWIPIKYHYKHRWHVRNADVGVAGCDVGVGVDADDAPLFFVYFYVRVYIWIPRTISDTESVAKEIRRWRAALSLNDTHKRQQQNVMMTFEIGCLFLRARTATAFFPVVVVVSNLRNRQLIDVITINVV